MTTPLKSPASNLTSKYEDERQRAHEQSQIVYLQGQIDELRRLIKDQTNKYQWAMEQSRKTESAVVQLQSLFEQHTEEVTRQTERSRRDIIELRKEIAGALVKIDESVTPIRDMQMQIHQLAEARKQDREQVAPWFSRLEDTEQKILGLQAQIREGEERQRQLEMQAEHLRDADSMTFDEVRRLGEELQVEKQSLRRQIVETHQLVAGLNSVLDDHNARLTRVHDLQEQIELFAEKLPEQIMEIEKKLPDISTEIQRVERVSNEWFMMNQDRMEDMRHTTNERLDALQETDQQHLRQLSAWLERIDGWVRELEQRITQTFNRIETAQSNSMNRITELERREIQAMHGLTNAFREQMESIKTAQTRLQEQQ